ncbi:DinB family protein [Gillisia sp. M10.2A]|uniref:DinB family protein n=1 Tax=Gillisia lutea TaxID=2909668 RepID=A0ABS9EGF8_9FLAO|nr:DinB family protein [Gillisia lutea]MCF4101975.1 DinB family protein [Gillisia lutea]
MENKNHEKLPEVWLRGSIPEVPALLQPAAHALLQAREDVYKYTQDFPDVFLWQNPAGRASVGFHLQHLTGVIDRMLTYASAKPLSENQFSALRSEGEPNENIQMSQLVAAFNAKVNDAIRYLKNTSESILTEPRTVGRKQLPSTVIGLLFHAAEHSQRHVGQLLVTISVLKQK